MEIRESFSSKKCCRRPRLPTPRNNSPCLASGSASCGQTTHKKLPQMYQPQPEQKGLKTIVRTDFRKTFPSSPQTGQRMLQNPKIENISRKSPAPLVSYTLFPAPRRFRHAHAAGNGIKISSSFPPEQSPENLLILLQERHNTISAAIFTSSIARKARMPGTSIQCG